MSEQEEETHHLSARQKESRELCSGEHNRCWPFIAKFHCFQIFILFLIINPKFRAENISKKVTAALACLYPSAAQSWGLKSCPDTSPLLPSDSSGGYAPVSERLAGERWVMKRSWD